MATANAPTTLDELKSLLQHDTKVKVAGIDVDGVLRGKIMSKSKFLSAVKGDGFGFCSVIFGWDGFNDETYYRELLISNAANGYRDILASIDLQTYRRIPWEDNLPFFLLSFLDPDTREPIPVCPRGTLSRVLQRARELGGWEPMAGAEYEYFQFRETASSLASKSFSPAALEPLTPGMHGYSLIRPHLNQAYFHALFDRALEFGIDVEGHHTETGPGVFETALAYTSALRMADNAILFKYLAKCVGMEHGVLPSFMAKPHEGLPGCSGHIHVSLRDPSTGRNIFAPRDEDVKSGKGREGAQYDDVRFISQEAEWFLAGLLEGLADVVPCFAPTINSYKRLVAGESMWAPNRSSYGYDSRSVSIRIISPPSVPPSATRFEVRVPGADVQPYFALSAIFALGLDGIARKLPLPHAPGREPAKGLATSLGEATRDMGRQGSAARRVLGQEWTDHFVGTREHEVRKWESAVTDWELRRYMELA